MKKIPIFLQHFDIKNVELKRLFEEKGHELSPQSISQKMNLGFKDNRFSKYELILLKDIEKEFLIKYREKLVKYKHLKYKENE